MCSLRMQREVVLCSVPGSVCQEKKKYEVLLNDVFMTSCVAVYTKYKQSDQGACWCAQLSGTHRFVLEQCLVSKFVACWKYFDFLLLFLFYTGNVYCEFGDVNLFLEWQLFQAQQKCRSGFLMEQKKRNYCKGCRSSNPLVSFSGLQCLKFCALVSRHD